MVVVFICQSKVKLIQVGLPYLNGDIQSKKRLLVKSSITSPTALVILQKQTENQVVSGMIFLQ